MAEHVGLSQLGEYAAHLHTLLSPGGRLLNHAISRRPGPPGDPSGNKTSFIDRYVFPDGELHPLSTIVDVLESAGFEVRDVESLREHYADTLRAWVTTSNRTGTPRCGSPAPAGSGCGGSTWPARHWGSSPTASASTRSSPSNRALAGAATCPGPAQPY